MSGQKANKKIILSGHVTDNKGNPVQGAMILIDNKNINKVTDAKGFYTIKVKPGVKEISAFTYNSGFGKAQIEGKTVVDIVLTGTFTERKVQENPVAEETVNIGYGKVSKKNLTTPVNKLDASENNYAIYTNIYDMIKGRIPGVEVNGKSITIQGANSFTSSTEPLLVVDGMIVPSIDNISPMEVKSIEVLKGAAATVYGSRGANGVILIYLKGAEDLRK